MNDLFISHQAYKTLPRVMKQLNKFTVLFQIGIAEGIP